VSGVIAAELRGAVEAMAGLVALSAQVIRAAEVLKAALASGHTVFACGNGGSAGEAQHFMTELSGRFRVERRGLAGVSLNSDGTALTAIGNDYGFERVFARQLEALARPGDVLVGLSTSGNSANVLRALELAREMGVSRIGLTGRDGGAMGPLCEVEIRVPLKDTARIQESHLAIIHALCAALDAN